MLLDPMTPTSDRLDGWKEIAAHLEKSVRTVQKWADQDSLPVSKLGGRAVAYRSELDLWVKRASSTTETVLVTQPTRPRRFLSRIAVMAIGAATVAAVWAGGVFWATHHAGPAMGYRVRGSVLEALDARDQVVWEHVFPGISQEEYPDQPSRDAWFGQRGLFVDLNQGRNRAFLFVYYPSDDHTSTLYCFRQDGAVLWSRKLGHNLTTANNSIIYGSYQTTLLATLRRPRPDGGVIIVASHHSYAWPEQVAILDSEGRIRSEYWHAGYFSKMVVGDWGGSEEIALGGVNNGFREAGYGPTVVILDPNRLGGQSGVPSGDLSHSLAGIPAAREAAVILFPDLIRDPLSPNAFNYVGDLEFSNGYLHVNVNGLENIHYQFDRHLSLASFEADQATKQRFGNGSVVERRTWINALTGIKILRNRFAAGAAVDSTGSR